jgi:hypothetical protein
MQQQKRRPVLHSQQKRKPLSSEEWAQKYSRMEIKEGIASVMLFVAWLLFSFLLPFIVYQATMFNLIEVFNHYSLLITIPAGIIFVLVIIGAPLKDAASLDKLVLNAIKENATNEDVQTEPKGTERQDQIDQIKSRMQRDEKFKEELISLIVPYVSTGSNSLQNKDEWLVKSTTTYNIAYVILAIPSFLVAVASLIALFHH